MAPRMISAAAVAVALMAAASPAVAAAETKLPFIGATIYATADGCVKLKAIAAGGGKSVSTVPEFLTETGFGGWEGGCGFTGFTGFTETRPGKSFEVRVTCIEGEEETKSTDIFELDVTTKRSP